MDIHLSKMCRICLKEGENLRSIFQNNEDPNNEVSISSKIMACAFVQVVAGDGLPELICHDCLTQVDVAYDFREKCQSADAILRKYVSIVQPFYPSIEKNIDIEPSIKLEVSETVLTTENEIKEEKSKFTEDNSDLLKSPKKEKADFPLLENEVEVGLVDSGKKKKQEKVVKRKIKREKTVKKCQVEDNSSCTDKKKHTKDTKDVTCPICKKTFAYFCILKDHMVQHTGAKPYLCSACGKSFGHTASLTNHMKTHYSDKPHKCDRCELSFHRRAHLVLHMRTHTGEKPFVCEICGREFAQSSYLKEHMRVHSGEKPFVCDICGHGFARKSCLVMHRRVHTGELPYACPECGRAFSQRSQRKRHVKRNHKGSACLRATGELILKDLDLQNKNSNREDMLAHNSINEGSINLPQNNIIMQRDERVPMQEYQPVSPSNGNTPMIIYHQDNMTALYPTSVVPLPILHVQTAMMQ